ncbi:MAG: hypothetical protein JNM27_18515, partial [Leptospirales bacterium]|nr:hypothetical protein [Leptospirales bacterium]
RDALDDLGRIVPSAGFRFVGVATPGEAIAKLIKLKPQIVIIDPSDLDLEPNALVRAIQKQDSAVQILIYSTREVALDGMIRPFKIGQKPLHGTTVIQDIKSALSYFEDNEENGTLTDDNSERIQSQLEWLVWRERVRVGDRVTLIISVLDTIRHAISQGVGIGSLVTMAEMIEFQASRDPSVEQALGPSLKSLRDSAVAVRQWMARIESTSRLLTRRYAIEEISADRLSLILSQALALVEPLRAIKNQTIVLREHSFQQPILANRNVLDMTFRELLTNAMKYSPDKTEIDVICSETPESAAISVRNDVAQVSNLACGVPLQYENQIFEPFFRLQNVFDERFKDEELGMGVGLTLVQSALNQVGAKIFVHEVQERKNGSKVRRVSADVTLSLDSPHAPAHGSRHFVGVSG